MNAVTNTWRQLVRRRLWPVAVLLLAALAAVPVVLARGPEPVAEPADAAPAVTSDAGDALAEPVVAKVAEEDRSHRRRVLGARKDPFEPAPLPKPKKPKTPKGPKGEATSAKPAAPTGGGGSVSSSSSSSSSSPSSSGTAGPVGGGGPVVTNPVAPAPATPKKKKKKHFPAGSLVVRFGDPTGDSLARMLVRKLDPLPDDESPMLVYMGPTKNHKKAIFLIDEAVTPDGDGTCKPHPASCETIELSKGETEFFEVTDPETGEVAAQYQLDLVAINHS
jgi:hypothetical protein